MAIASDTSSIYDMIACCFEHAPLLPLSLYTGAVRAADLALALDICCDVAIQGGAAQRCSRRACPAQVLQRTRTCNVYACHNVQVIATIRQGGRPEVPLREELPGPDTAGWAGLDAYVQLMR